MDLYESLKHKFLNQIYNFLEVEDFSNIFKQPFIKKKTIDSAYTTYEISFTSEIPLPLDFPIGFKIQKFI